MSLKKLKRDQTAKFRCNDVQLLTLGNVEDGFDDMGKWPDGRERAS